MTFSKNASRGTWEDAGEKRVENFYAVTALAWKSDGSKLSVGNLTGVVDTYDACVRRRTYKNQFECTHASAPVVVDKRLSTNRRVAMRAKDGSEVRDVRVRNDRYVVANTAGGSLLVGDLDACKMSEVAWNFTGRETFDFDVEKACVVRNAGEISVVEYGVDEVIGTVRTPHAAQHLVSVLVRDRRGRDRRGAARAERARKRPRGSIRDGVRHPDRVRVSPRGARDAIDRSTPALTLRPLFSAKALCCSRWRRMKFNRRRAPETHRRVAEARATTGATAAAETVRAAMITGFVCDQRWPAGSHPGCFWFIAGIRRAMECCVRIGPTVAGYLLPNVRRVSLRKKREKTGSNNFFHLFSVYTCSLNTHARSSSTPTADARRGKRNLYT